MPGDADRVDDIAQHGAPREELLKILKNKRPVRTWTMNRRILHKDLALTWFNKTCYRLEQRGFATTRWSDNHKFLALPNREASILDDGRCTITPIVIAQIDMRNLNARITILLSHKPIFLFNNNGDSPTPPLRRVVDQADTIAVQPTIFAAIVEQRLGM